MLYLQVPITYLGLPWDSDGKASACSAGDPGSIPGSGRSPGEGNGNPLQYSCLKNSMDCRLRSLAGDSPWSRKESDSTERLYYYILEHIIKAGLSFCQNKLELPKMNDEIPAVAP